MKFFFFKVSIPPIRAGCIRQIDYKKRYTPEQTLTVLFVEQDFELVVVVALQHFVDSAYRLLVREISVHEWASAWLLHHLNLCECVATEMKKNKTPPVDWLVYFVQKEKTLLKIDVGG